MAKDKNLPNVPEPMAYDTLLGVVASEKEQKVLICNNCKDIWITPIDMCDCGCTTLTETHPSNYKYARNYTQCLYKLSKWQRTRRILI